MSSLESRLKDQARALGFDLVGIAPAEPADGFDKLQDWLDKGYAGDMDYMHRHGDARRHPHSILPGVRCVVMVGLNYNPWPEACAKQSSGKIARYAQGDDYHDVLRAKLKSLLHWVQAEVPGCAGRAVVDTAPLLERDYARRAGLGWFGKNTMLLNTRLGSYFFLGALLLDLELGPDAPFATRHCGTCTACLDACPTDAFIGPGVLDSRRCISYLTIELRGPIAPELREGIGDWLLGCDVCQEVCPWNRKAPFAREPAFETRVDLRAIELSELFGLDEAEFRRRFKRTALYRARRSGLLRNAAIVLGNTGDRSALPALERARTDADPVVREAAEWAIARIQQRLADSEPARNTACAKRQATLP
jgi:epoxyqueuosine reductase